MRLYVWEGVLQDYTPGIAFTLASTADEARNLIATSLGGSEYIQKMIKKELAGRPRVFTKPIGFGLYGGG